MFYLLAILLIIGAVLTLGLVGAIVTPFVESLEEIICGFWNWYESKVYAFVHNTLHIDQNKHGNIHGFISMVIELVSAQVGCTAVVMSIVIPIVIIIGK